MSCLWIFSRGQQVVACKLWRREPAIYGRRSGTRAPGWRPHRSLPFTHARHASSHTKRAGAHALLQAKAVNFVNRVARAAPLSLHPA